MASGGGRPTYCLMSALRWKVLGVEEGGVAPVHKGQVDAPSQVGGGQDEDVGEPLDGVYLGLWR